MSKSVNYHVRYDTGEDIAHVSANQARRMARYHVARGNAKRAIVLAGRKVLATVTKAKNGQVKVAA